MGLFGRKKKDFTRFPEGDFEPVLRCSICTGEQVLCAREGKTGKLLELMLIRNPRDIDDFCEANGLNADEIEKIY